MKYLLMTLAFIQTCLYGMEIEQTKFTINKDSILYDLNRIPLHNQHQTNGQNSALADLVARLHDLKYLHDRDRGQTDELWQNPNFTHWLTWFEAELKKTIMMSTHNNGYFESEDTILHYAASHHDYKLLKFLIDMNITPRFCTYTTLTHVKNKTIAQFLIKHGESVNKTDSIPLNVIMGENIPTELLQFYLKKGADVHYSNARGTALHWLVVHDKTHPVEDFLLKAQLLIDYKVPINKINKHGKTALDESLTRIECWKEHPEYQQPHKELAALLGQHGAKKAIELPEFSTLHIEDEQEITSYDHSADCYIS